jgi:hypothetical protein
VSAVFTRSKEREGAYAESMFMCTAVRARGEGAVYVPIDLTSLSLTDLDGERFGPIGSPNRPVRGLMVANAFAVTMDGVPLGLIDQQYWMRDETEVLPKNARTERNHRRPFEDKQGSRFTSAAQDAVRRLDTIGVLPWVIIDREGDNRDILFRLMEMKCAFTVRASCNRKVGDAPIPTVVLIAPSVRLNRPVPRVRSASRGERGAGILARCSARSRPARARSAAARSPSRSGARKGGAGVTIRLA